MHHLPKLSYEYNALAPIIDETTMIIHHTKHHQTYVDKLNAAVTGTKYESRSVEDLLKNLWEVDENIRMAVRNHWWWHHNHTLFWQMIKPKWSELNWKVLEKINESFENFEAFKNQFTQAALNNFGSGWTRLVANSNQDVTIINTPNQDSPLTIWLKPILWIDLREHAYYLNYQNRRNEYLNNRRTIVNRDFVNELLGA